MNITERMEREGHEQLCIYTDPGAGLRAFIAVHDTTLGPALGGARMWTYRTDDEAVTDVLRLSRAMSYKTAAAGLPLGGGKAVVVGDPHTQRSEALFRAFGRAVDSLGGRYLTTEDVGTSMDDLEHIAAETDHVTGLPEHQGGSGDSSAATALGVYRAMRACAAAALGSDDLGGVRVALQGLGKVGRALARHLLEAGARVTATDVDPAALSGAEAEGLEILRAPDAIYDAECEVFAPCALGGVLNPETVPRLRCRVVCGGANNQLLDDEDARALHERGILYAPDYVANAGGVINLSFEVGRPYDPEAARQKILQISDTVEQVLDTSRREGVTTVQAANRLVEERLRSVRAIRPVFRPGG